MVAKILIIILFMFSSYLFLRNILFESYFINPTRSIAKNVIRFKIINKDILEKHNSENAIYLQRKIEKSIHYYNYDLKWSNRKYLIGNFRTNYQSYTFFYILIWIVINLILISSINNQPTEVTKMNQIVLLYLFPAFLIFIFIVFSGKSTIIRSIKLLFENFPAYSTFQYNRLKRFRYKGKIRMYTLYPAISNEVEQYYAEEILRTYGENKLSYFKESEQSLINEYRIFYKSILTGYSVFYVSWVILLSLVIYLKLF